VSVGADVVVVTCDPMPVAEPEHAPVLAALAARGLKAEVVQWDAKGFDWAAPRACVIRSTWDYFQRRDEFVAWAERVPHLWNPAKTVRWNTHKHYLRELAARGIPFIPTEWVDRGAQAPELGALMAEKGWDEVVVKPAVSAGAFRTLRIGRATLTEGNAHLAALAAERDVMIQPYLHAVERAGERALIYVDGALTHTVRKRPALIEGTSGEADLVMATDDERALAAQIFSGLDDDLLYARVDVVRDEGGQLLLMELELVEPFLFLRYCPEAAGRLADGISRRI
jgi:hypothetical protein